MEATADFIARNLLSDDPPGQAQGRTLNEGWSGCGPGPGPYSTWRAMVGSTFRALRTGRTVATNMTPPNTRLTTT